MEQYFASIGNQGPEELSDFSTISQMINNITDELNATYVLSTQR